MTAVSLDKDRLRWQCRRGMLELDVLFESFLDHGYDDLDDAGRQQFFKLLTFPDQDLQRWLVNGDAASDPRLEPLLESIRHSVPTGT